MSENGIGQSHENRLLPTIKNHANIIVVAGGENC